MLDLLFAVQLMCAPLGEVDTELRTKHQEQVLVNLPKDNATMRIYVGKTTWTIVLVEGQVACLIGSGEGKIKFGTPGEDS